jgi:hypothetical protein
VRTARAPAELLRDHRSWCIDADRFRQRDRPRRLEKVVAEERGPGRCQWPHVLELVRRKIEDLDWTLADLTDVRRGLQELLRASSRSARRGGAAVCHHIERLTLIGEVIEGADQRTV